MFFRPAAAAAAKLLQSCLTLCNPIDGSPPGSPVPGILQARTLEWVAISFSNAWKWKVKVKSLSRVRLFETPWTTAYQVLHLWDFPGKRTGVGFHCLLSLGLQSSFYKNSLSLALAPSDLDPTAYPCLTCHTPGCAELLHSGQRYWKGPFSVAEWRNSSLHLLGHPELQPAPQGSPQMGREQQGEA